MSDLYEILGVSRSATKQEIRAAYKSKANKLHPDKENGNTERFKKINEAYMILHNPSRKNQYDSTGYTGNELDVQALVNSLLSQLFADAINKKLICNYVNISRDAINATLETANKDKKTLAKKIYGLNIKAERVKTSNSFNAYRSVINMQITQISEKLKKAEEFLIVGKEALKQLETYEDTSPEENTSPFFGSTTTSFTKI